MKKFMLIVLLSLLLAGCGEVVAPVATPSSTTSPITAIDIATPTQAPPVVKRWHITHHFTNLVSFLGTTEDIPDRVERVTVTSPWRIAWQAHLGSQESISFTLVVCQEV